MSGCILGADGRLYRMTGGGLEVLDDVIRFDPSGRDKTASPRIDDIASSASMFDFKNSASMIIGPGL